MDDVGTQALSPASSVPHGEGHGRRGARISPPQESSCPRLTPLTSVLTTLHYFPAVPGSLLLNSLNTLGMNAVFYCVFLGVQPAISQSSKSSGRVEVASDKFFPGYLWPDD